LDSACLAAYSAGIMRDNGNPNPSAMPNLADAPSPPRARRWLRFMLLMGLLALACAAVWCIDRGALNP